MIVTLKTAIFFLSLAVIQNVSAGVPATERPSIYVQITVHPWNKVHILPHSLSSILHQVYPLNRVTVSIYSGWMGDDCDHYGLNNRTLKIIDTFVHLGKMQGIRSINHYSSYYGCDKRVDRTAPSQVYWTEDSYRRIMAFKTKGLREGRESFSDWTLLMDADVVWSNRYAFSHLMDISEGPNMQIFAPVLTSKGTYSNFWGQVSATGYYERSPDYLAIVNRDKTGWFSVPLVHSAVFIRRSPETNGLSFYPETKVSIVDDVICFAESAKKLGLKPFVTNHLEYGHILPPVEGSGVRHQLQWDQLIHMQTEELTGYTSRDMISVMRKADGKYSPAPKSMVTPSPTDLILPFVLHSMLEPFTFKENPAINVPIFVINLERRPDRWFRMYESLKLLRLDHLVQRVNATDGKDLSMTFLEKESISPMPGFQDPYHKRNMTLGEIGCFLSHYHLWQKVINGNLTSAIILEDDVRFSDGFIHTLKEGLVEAGSSFDLIYLGRKRQIGDTEVEPKVSQLLVQPGYSYWTIGYVVSKEGASKLIQSKPLQSLIPVDEYLPLMYGQHPKQQEWADHFPSNTRNLKALAFSPVIIDPTHYVGDDMYISDTEESAPIVDTGSLTRPRMQPGRSNVGRPMAHYPSDPSPLDHTPLNGPIPPTRDEF